ncbi:unnamed protein product [Mortierella alpina]
MDFPHTRNTRPSPAPRLRTPATKPVPSASAPCTSSSSFSPSRLTHRKLLAGCLLALSLLSQVAHAVDCIEPSVGSFKAGDSLTLNWNPGKDVEIVDIRGALYCDTGNKIADIPLSGTAGPQTWTVPSVGNATTPGGTTGLCAQNSFHVEYSGRTQGFAFLTPPFGPIRCPTIIISPAANNNFTTTPATSPTASTGASSSGGRVSSTGSSSGKPSSTNAVDENGSSEPKTHVVIIVAIVAVLILSLVAVVIVWRTRKQRRKRMADAIMPWSSSNNNQFSKMSSSSTDDGHRAYTAAAAVGLNKSQPAVPQPTHHQDDSYAYNQYPHKQGYSDVGYNEGGYDNPQDEYYNPYYATGVPAGTQPAYYSGRTPHQDAHANPSGYFPPPPPLNSNAHVGMGPVSGAMSPPLASTPLTTGTLVSSSSHLRGPQALVETEPMSEMSNQSDKRGQRGSPQAIPMKVLSPGT